MLVLTSLTMRLPRRNTYWLSLTPAAMTTKSSASSAPSGRYRMGTPCRPPAAETDASPPPALYRSDPRHHPRSRARASARRYHADSPTHTTHVKRQETPELARLCVGSGRCRSSVIRAQLPRQATNRPARPGRSRRLGERCQRRERGRSRGTGSGAAQLPRRPA